MNRFVLKLLLFTMLCGCGNRKKFISIKGSDTEVNLAVDLAENFKLSRPDLDVSVSGGGSGLGIASLLNGQADIANSSRPLTEDEIALFKKNGVSLHTVIFAEDATAFVVNKELRLDSIEVNTLGKVLSGQVVNWKAVTGQDLPVNIYGRQSNSGTHSFVQNKLGIQFANTAKEMNGNAQILEGIKADISGIGYVGAGYVTAAKMNAFKILKIKASKGQAAVSPEDASAILGNRYFFQRPLYQFVPSKSWAKALPFILFEQGAAGQLLIVRSGYYKVDNNMK